MKNYRIRKGKNIHVNQLASYSRKFTVSNTKKGISPVIAHKRIGGDIPKDKLITSPYTGIQYVMTNPHPVYGNLFGVSITGYDWVPIDEYKANNGLLWEHKKYPQPKRLHKKQKEKTVSCKTSLTHTRLLTARKSEFPDYTLPKMNKIQYMEKLVEHKLAKWERKNVCPEAMFTEDVAKWKQERETMKERFRDFVVSIYDKLHLTGRFVVAKDKYTEEKVAEIKDVNGEGHHINDLPKTSKLIKKAQKITNETKAKRQNLVATNLKDHKKQKGRIILPQAA